MVRTDRQILVLVGCEIYRGAIMGDIDFEVSTNQIVPISDRNRIVDNHSIIGDILPDIMQRSSIGCVILRVDSENTGLHLSHCERSYAGDSRVIALVCDFDLDCLRLRPL